MKQSTDTRADRDHQLLRPILNLQAGHGRKVTVGRDDDAVRESASGRRDHHVDDLHRAAVATQFCEEPAVFSGHLQRERPQSKERKFAIEDQQIPFSRLAELDAAEHFRDDR